MRKRIVLLGAMQMHLPLIRRAAERDIDIVTVDYTVDNPGHKLAQKAYFDSTTDLEAVERIAREEKADGIMTFNSDPAAYSAACVAERLELPGSGREAVAVMSAKDSFRKFLGEHGFNVPKFRSYRSYEEAEKEMDSFSFPVMLKPVDSSGSKGVVRIGSATEIKDAFENALDFSRCKRVIIEEFIEADGPQLHGDGFVADGELKFLCLGDHHFDSAINNLVPISTTFPSRHSAEEIEKVRNEVARFIKEVGFRQGGINIEARISKKDGKPYLIEVGPRNGGNFTPVVIGKATGFDFVDAALDAALGLPYKEQTPHPANPTAYLIVHSKEDGKLENVTLSYLLESRLFGRYDYVKPGEEVRSFMGANVAAGVLLASFRDMEEMERCVEGMDENIKITTVKSMHT